MSQQERLDLIDGIQDACWIVRIRQIDHSRADPGSRGQQSIDFSLEWISGQKVPESGSSSLNEDLEVLIGGRHDQHLVSRV